MGNSGPNEGKSINEPADARALHAGVCVGWMDPADARALHAGAGVGSQEFASM